jgi:crotonobetaine/carnitine-CoA ligase
MILADLVRIRAEQRPDLDVLTFEHLSLDGGATPDEVRTYSELATRGNRIAAALIDRGLERGARFGLMMRNHPEFVEAMLAASISGCVFVPIDPRTKADKLAFMLRNSGCRGIVCADYCLAEVDAVRDRTPDLGWVLALETGEGADAIPLASVGYAESLREAPSRSSTPRERRATPRASSFPTCASAASRCWGPCSAISRTNGHTPDSR